MSEGTNPIVVSSGNKRKKLNSRENATISDGDIIELIPGDHFLKYEALAGERIGSSSDFRKRSTSDSRNIPQQPCRIKASGRNLEETCSREGGRNQMKHKSAYFQSSQDSNTEAIHYLLVSDDELPLTFRLLRVKGLPPWANTSCFSIENVIQGDILVAILSNYMVDIDWLISACPTISKVLYVLVIHGESDGRVDYMKWPEFSVKLPSKGNFSICSSFFNKFDYNDALVRLVSSVPGYHSGAALKKWGHMKLRFLLQECTFEKEFKNFPLFIRVMLKQLEMQFQVLGSEECGQCAFEKILGEMESRPYWPQMSCGLGSSNIARKMFMVEFGQDKFNCMLLRIDDIVDVYINFSSHFPAVIQLRTELS